MITPPDTDDEPIQVVIGYYDDWYRPDLAHFVLLATQGYEDWEHEAIIAAHAVYAEQFLNLN